jgi:hypothetical protein
MSDFEVLTTSDATPKPNSEERSVSESVLRGTSCSRRDGKSAVALNTGRAHGNPVLHPQGKKIAPSQPEQVLRAFNTWAFKREQPSDPQLILQFVAHAVAHRQPIAMLFYWGKGPRCKIDDPDLKCLDYLTALARRVAAAYEPGIAVRLIFTDTHASLNGYSKIGIDTYFAAIESEARRRGFECCRLSNLIEETQAQAEDYPLDGMMPDDLLVKLSASAMKWYHGEGSAEEGALKYFHMNMIEKRAVELSFPNAIFATFNSSKFRILFPKRLPIFYMYSLQRGVSVKPWFLPLEARPCNPSSCQCSGRDLQTADRP